MQSADGARYETGVIQRWLRDRRFGFIRPDAGGGAVFCHLSALADGEPIVGGRVRFLRIETAKGPRAADVEPCA